MNTVEFDLLPDLHIITHQQDNGHCWTLFAKEPYRVRYVAQGAVQCEEAAGPERTTGDYVASVQAGEMVEVVFADGAVIRVTVNGACHSLEGDEE